MFCSPWDCQWKAPDRPFVFRSADGRLPRKSPMQPMRLSESRSELKTPANMPSLRQLEFAFKQFAIRVVERRDTVVVPQTVAASLWDAPRDSFQLPGEGAAEVSGGASGAGAPGDAGGACGAGAAGGGAAGAGIAGCSLCGMNAISSICQRPTGCEMVRSISAYLAG